MATVPVELRVDIEPAGIGPDLLELLRRRVIEHRVLREFLPEGSFRLVDLRQFEDGEERRFRATFYDYARQRTVEATGWIDGREGLELTDHDRQPLPSTEEFEEALSLLRRDPRWRTAVDGDAVPMWHVPPVIGMPEPDGRIRRAIGVVLAPRGWDGTFQILAVDLAGQEVHVIEQSGRATGRCGPISAGQSSVTGVPGQARITVWQGETRLWRMLVTRPPGSSGTNGSGLELREVDYRDTQVLRQAHVPLLNVHYDAHGPLLDWQNKESPFQADGTDPVPGFRLCTSPPATILESGKDRGNFSGVAVFTDGSEVVLLTEMQAGWYRYVHSWRFHADGTIRPRFGFSAVHFPKVCNRHHHHCYWRLDFGSRGPEGTVVSEFNDPPLAPGWDSWHDIPYETQRGRDYGSRRTWRVSHADSAGYEIVPGPGDGVATAMPDWPFPQGDLWFVRHKPDAEVDNGIPASTGDHPCEANIGNFVDGESIRDGVVVWYGAHFTHEVTEHGDHAGHVVGPDLVPVNRP